MSNQLPPYYTPRHPQPPRNRLAHIDVSSHQKLANTTAAKTAQKVATSGQPPRYSTTTIIPRTSQYFHEVPRGWVIMWFAIYLIFVILDIFYPTSFPPITALKYLGIVGCCVYAWLRFPGDRLLSIALSFTLLADTIFIINNTSIVGIFVFCLAQFFHFTRLHMVSPRALLIYFLGVIAIFFFGVIQQFSPIFLMATIYAGTLALNFLASANWYHQTRSVASFCAFFGFTLFVCCDFCVATSYLSAISVLPVFLYDYANFFAWFFYYPSQIFISNSSKTMIQ